MRDQIYSDITNAIIAAIEAGTEDFQMPWHRSDKDHFLPVNIDTGKTYQGINILFLWIIADAHDYETNIWGTSRQWQKRGCQVREGEPASPVVYGPIAMSIKDENDKEAEPIVRSISRSFEVFNADQVDGHDILPSNPFPPIETVERFVAGTGATVRHGGARAFYQPSVDCIFIPKPERFIDTETSTATENYYSTLLHELVHWTSTANRCNRKFGKRFGDHAYAFEELVAELGAAFLCADLHVSLEPRPDHSQYINSWLAVLKKNKKAIFTAASQASKAVGFLSDCQPSEQEKSD